MNFSDISSSRAASISLRSCLHYSYKGPERTAPWISMILRLTYYQQKDGASLQPRPIGPTPVLDFQHAFVFLYTKNTKVNNVIVWMYPNLNNDNSFRLSTVEVSSQNTFTLYVIFRHRRSYIWCTYRLKNLAIIWRYPAKIWKHATYHLKAPQTQ